METYQQVDQECDRLQDQATFNQHVQTREAKKQELKDVVSLQYQLWKEMLAQSERDIHAEIDRGYQHFNQVFDEQSELIKEAIDKGQKWQEKVCAILDNHTQRISSNPDYISFDLLDVSESNPRSVETVYAEAETWLKEST